MSLFDFNAGLDWSNPFDSLTASASEAGSNPGAYDPFQNVGSGMFDYAKQNGFDLNNYSASESEAGGGGQREAFNNWFDQNGFTMKSASDPTRQYWQAFQGDTPIGKSVGATLADPMFNLAGTALAAGAGGLMGAGLGTMAKGAITGGLGGMAGSGGDPSAGLKGALMGGLGGYAAGGFNPASNMGIENTYLQKAVNSGLTGGLKSMLSGGDVVRGALGGAASPLINYGASELGLMPSGSLPTLEGGSLDGAPDIGSGSAMDSMGESSVTMGGELPTSMATQALGEAQLGRSQQQPEGVAKIMSALGLEDVGPLTGFGGAPINVGNLAGGLMGLYSAYDQRKRASEMMKMMSGNFGQGGSYAKALRQQLDRRDAAGGRRSQYGPREVELQAKLAQMNASQAPALAQLYGMKTKGTNAALNNLLNIGKEVDIGAGLKSLADYFKGGN